MSSEPIIPILIVDDQMVLRIGLKIVLEGVSGVNVIGEASDGQAAIDLVKRLRPAIVFMDVAMPKLDGIQATQLIKENHPQTRVIMFTSSDDDKVFFGALSAGADGYCLKDATKDQLAGAINAVMQGAKWLDAGVANKLLRGGQRSKTSGARASFSGEQRQILEMIDAGLGISEIAQGLNQQITDVKIQLRDIVTRLQSPEAIDKSADSALLKLKAILESKAATSSQPQPSRNRVGQCLSGKYMVEDIIGSGGMSVVYRARHMVIGKLVAIKMLHSNLLTDETSVKRLQNEARAASSISHPNIVAIHDFGVSEDDQPYLVMDYAVGDTLGKVLDNYKKLQTKLCLQICLDVCDALIALHSHNIVHRDLKPSNIILVDNKGGLVAKLLDFGIAKIVSTDESAHRLTRTGEIFGSPQFMSPEQCLGETVDHRADLYAVGCIIYEMLTGEQAFGGEVPYNIMWRQINELPSRLAFLHPENQVPVRLESAIFKLMSKQIDKRFQTAQELKDELEAIYQPYL
jgi:DNA-binding NarL/FixJ family response regulator/tRNA A-37 threonylcarbamoyl transferase component Bud32